MADKKPTVAGIDTGATPDKFKLPTYEKTDPEGSADAKTSKTPFDKIPTTTVTPYGK